jgi:NRPS condensation-like uncharacterized protein
LKKLNTRKKKKQETPFQQYMETLSDGERETVFRYFSRWNEHVALNRSMKTAMLADFETALLYYADSGTPLNQALLRMDVESLGGFFARPAVQGHPLDDAAKIYPLSMKQNEMAVFRLSVYLKEYVVPEVLQIALTFTVKRFPSFATTVKKGFFWHYLDAAKRRYAVEPETDVPCRPLNIAASGSQSFRVLYFENRISVEFFHVLTDGTGGMAFLKTLTAEYLRLLGANIPPGSGVYDRNETPDERETENGFSLAENSEKSAGFLDRPAVQMSGRLSSVKPCKILHFHFSATALKTAAKEKNATITAFILAQMFVAQKNATDERGGEIGIQVPVNMRKFYHCETLRNFALYCGVRLPLREITDADAILPAVSEQLAKKTSKSAMNEMMNATLRMVRSLRWVPLVIKRPAASIVYGFLGDKIFSNTLSNLGVVTLPEEMAPFIDHFDFILGTAKSNRASCTLVTYNDTATFTVAKLTDDPSFEERLYRQFADAGLQPRVEGSQLYGY